ncbi:NADH dehydrogenase [ubiquinone] 1 beta subcomplex subunit 11, mitochondrial isoform X1 [Ahaetulla prasina]|uniref:NADH dehydrogenase [ubiquinone] 1 beta subcomplex subunit 11, mitochondrial isoform X1 n=1 Tax=Ahaetulla prasina TaxID=499056 RepID=UPI002647586F|nr:NADH dehydrogenase [ubiquinone] 1 beta subcomplex subunit 11, mitochondrial isoform X1 [Ahaetulla prasina]
MLTMAALRRLAGLQRLLGLPARAVSSDQTTNSTVSARISRAPRPLEVVEWHPIKEHEETNPFIKNPDFHGFSEDPVVDVQNMRAAFFFGISICLVLGTVFLYYLPDHKMHHWARREAERRVKERAEKGLPILSSYYFDPSKIVLPPEEED